MTYLIALVVAILIGALIVLLLFMNMGSSFSDQTGKGEAQEAITRATEIETAYIAFEALYSSRKIQAGEAGCGGNPDLLSVDNLFVELIDETSLLKQRVRDGDLTFCLEVDEESDGLGDLVIVFDNNSSCEMVNLLRHGTDEVPNCNTNINDLSCCIGSNGLEIVEPD